MRYLTIILTCCILLAGCAHIISKESRDLVDSTVSFHMIKEKPEAYQGIIVMIGGVIAAVRNSSAGGEIEIVQHELDYRGRPEPSSMSTGRFLARSNKFLDPLVFLRGHHVTVVGRVEGREKRFLDGVSYSYPVVSIRELQLLKPDQDSPYPTFHFGIGVGTVF